MKREEPHEKGRQSRQEQQQQQQQQTIAHTRHRRRRVSAALFIPFLSLNETYLHVLHELREHYVIHCHG